MWWIENMDLKLKTAIPAPRAPQSSLSPNTRVHHSLENLPFPPTLLTRHGTPLCTAAPWEQPQIAWTRFMLDFGGLFNHLLLLQHLTKFVPKNSVQKKEKKKRRKSILGLPNFKLITAGKISGDKNGYLCAVSDSFPVGAAWSLLCQHFFSHRIETCGVLHVL